MIKIQTPKFEIIKKYGGKIVITNGVTELAPELGFLNWREARAAYNFLVKNKIINKKSNGKTK